MELMNIMNEHKVNNRDYLKKLALLLAPFAPHMMEEVWVEYLGMPFSIHKASWPKYEAKYIVQNEATVVVQINGKVRSQLVMPSENSTDQEKVEEAARKDKKIAGYLEGAKIKNIIFISGKLLNFVAQ
jgi:leucyl-tRNA synthetase